MKKLLYAIVVMLCVSLIAVFSLASCTTAEEPVAEEKAAVKEEAPVAEEEVAELTPVVWAIDSFVNSIPQLAARELGYFEDEGVDIELRVFGMGAECMDQIIAKEADLGIGAHWALALRMTQPNLGLGGELIDWNDVRSEFWVSKDISEVSDLKGKAVATMEGTVWDYVVTKTLEVGGLTRDDVRPSNFSIASDYLSAAVKGDISAGWWEAQNLEKVEEVLEPLGWHSLGTTNEIVPDLLKGFIILPMSIEAANEKPEALVGALKAYQRGVDWVNANPEEAGKLAEDLMGIDAKDAEFLIKQRRFETRFSGDIVDLIRGMKEFALEQGYISEDYNLDEKILSEPMKLAFPEKVDENL